MKTIYQKPETKVIIVNMHKMVCASPGATPQVGGQTNNVNDLLSRQRVDVWGDDDDNEFE